MASGRAGCFRLRICMNMFVSSCYGCLSLYGELFEVGMQS